MSTVHLVKTTDTDTSEVGLHVLHADIDPAEFLTQEFTYDGPAVFEEITKEGQSRRRFTITTREGIYTAEVIELHVTMPHEITE